MQECAAKTWRIWFLRSPTAFLAERARSMRLAFQICGARARHLSRMSLTTLNTTYLGDMIPATDSRRAHGS
jgi:hypothetical protein